MTVIASPEDAEQFTAKGGPAALDRLQWTSQPPRLIATPAGDHSAHHPAILAAIRNAVLPVAAASPSRAPPGIRHHPAQEPPNPLAANRIHLLKGSCMGMSPTAAPSGPRRDQHQRGSVA